MACNSKKIGKLKINRILGMMRSKKYVVYKDPYKLNVIGVRNANTQFDEFDDTMYVIWKDDNNKWEGKEYAITTDPSTKYLNRGGYTSGKGTAILPNGQYVDKWTIRTHNGKYQALGQRNDTDGKICVYRDYNRDSTLTFNIEDKTCGNYGINIHKAKSGGADDGQGNTKKIGSYSAGCQVFQNSFCFEEFMSMARKQRDLYGNLFSYTLFDKSLQRKFFIKRTIYTTLILSSLSLIGFGVYKLTKNKL
tara:strand:- start:53 stop:799 length:747 start_codon:yes stop_codon:yes gene_type:complete